MSPIKECEDWLTKECRGRALLTPSCTSALEIAVRLSIDRGDEVILPSFTFSSCANAIILAGGVPVFVDVEPQTLNLNPLQVEAAITPRTKAVMPVWYAGVRPDLPALLSIVLSHNLKLIEDSAQAVGSYRLAKDFGCFSFHKSKNVSCGEGGALIVSEELYEKAHIFAHCGTTHPKPDWDWVSVGTHGLMSEYTALELWKNLQRTEVINEQRRKVWRIYKENIQAEEKASEIGNGHIFWFFADDRDELLTQLNAKGIKAVKHYTPLHNRGPGLRHGRFLNDCPVTRKASSRIVRLPMNVSEEEALTISTRVNEVLYERERRSVRRVAA